MRRRLIDVTTTFREDGELVTRTFRIAVGRDDYVPDDGVELSRAEAMAPEGRAGPGDWLPFARVPREIEIDE